MEPIPNWYRWLLIVIATLIMCACRSPLQDNAQPLLPSAGSIVPSRKAEPDVGKVLATSQHDRYLHALGSRRHPRVSPTGDLAPNASLTKSAEEWPARTNEFAPVIRTDQQGKLQLQKIQSILVAPAGDLPPEPAKRTTESESKPAVYLRVEDQSDDVLPVSNAHIDDEVRTLTSVAEDPLTPPKSELPLAPVIDGNTQIPRPQVEVRSVESVVSDGAEVGEPIMVAEHTVVGEHVIVGEPVIVGEHTIVGEPIMVSDGTETFTELYPSDCPIPATPDCWETLPGGPMNLGPRDLARRYPDEYICDGGDSQSSVHVRKDWSLQGLDPEDTVGHYDKLDGGLVVEPSNRVCIYAPRFAAVRHVTGAHEEEKYLQVQLAQRDLLAVTNEGQQIADQFHQNLAAQRHLGLQPPASFKSRQPRIESRQSQGLHSLDKDVPLHENLLVMKYGVHKQSEKARLAEFTAKAIAWSHDKAVQIVIDEVVSQTRVTRQGTDEIFSIGERGPAKFRVIKTASVSDALPGEEVEFTLRFDNIGYQPIGNVTIVDNLTTRLEYIEDSQLCSLDADFVNDENQVDSLTLRWEILDPVAPGKGGLIRFRCRVR